LIDLVNIDGVVGLRGGAAPGTEGRNVDHVAIAIRPFERERVRAHLAAHGVAIDAAVGVATAVRDGREPPSATSYARFQQQLLDFSQ